MKMIFLMGMLLVDLLLSSLIASSFAYTNIIFVPMTSLLFLSYRMMHNPNSIMLVYGFVVGLFVDLMMHSLLFTHAIIYVVALLLLKEYQRHFSDTLVEIVIMGLIVIFAKEIMLFVLMSAMNIIDISMLRWYGARLFFTLIGNIPLILFAYTISNQFNKVMIKQEITKKRSETSLWRFSKD